MEKAEPEGHGDGQNIVMTFMENDILSDLAKKGFEVPARRTLQETLTSQLEPLPVGYWSHHNAASCSYGYFLNLFWVPLLKYIEDLGNEAQPEWSKSLEVNHSAIVAEMDGIVPSPAKTMDMDSWIEYLQSTLQRILHVHVPTRLVGRVVAPIVPLNMEPTPSNALLILRSSLCQKLVGHAMAVQANRMILAEMAEVPVKLLPEPEFNLLVKRDLISSLEQQQCGHACDEEITTSPFKKHKRNQDSVVETLKDTVDQVIWFIKNGVTMWRAQETISSAASLVASMSGSSSSQEHHVDLNLVSRFTLKRGLLLLDGGVDRCLSDSLWNLREHGRFAGVAMATDESPPSQPRFRGLRFQITVMYWGAFEPVDQWERCDEPPILRTSCLADICHCPGKNKGGRCQQDP